MADLYAQLLEEVRAEREAHRRRFPGVPLYPAPSPADDAAAMFPKLCAVIEEMRAEREALVARVEVLEARTQTAGERLVQVLREEGEE